MGKRLLHVFIGLIFAAVFVWLSLKEVDSREVLREILSASFWWTIPYVVIAFAGNLARAERWKMVLDDETGQPASRNTLFAGLFYGLSLNMVIPRAGEVFRAVYVARKTGIETTRLFGTIVLERIIDLFMMLMMLMITFILLVKDEQLLIQIFGSEGAAYITAITSTTGILIVAGGMLVATGILWYLRTFRKKATAAAIRKGAASDTSAESNGDVPAVNPVSLMKNFVRGLISIRNLKNWPLFVFYTLVIWSAYVAMSYLPFFAFGFPSDYAFGWEQAFVITVIGAVGVILPSPGGIGTFHYLVQQGLIVLYKIPALTALAYATVNHLANVVMILLVTLIVYIANQLAGKNQKEEKIPFSELFR